MACHATLLRNWMYTESEFFKLCEDYRVPNDPMRYRDEKFYWTYQHGVHWPNDYIGLMTTLAQI